MKKPLLDAGKELALASGCLYAGKKTAKYGISKLDAHSSKKSGGVMLTLEEEDDAYWKSFCVINMACDGVVPVASYFGLSKLMQTLQPSGIRFNILPTLLSRRPPLPLPHTIGIVLMAFVFSPVFSCMNGIVSTPVIEYYHARDINHNSEEKGKDPAKNERGMLVPTPSQPPAPKSPRSQISVGTKYLTWIEEAVPGYATIFVPLQEETFFRGLLFARLIPSIGPLPAALCSSTMFDHAHKGAEGSRYIPISETIMGLSFCWLYFWTGGRLLVPLALHSGNNAWVALCSSLEPALVKVGAKWCSHENIDECLEIIRDLPFWERLAVKNIRAIDDALAMILAFVARTTHEESAPFLPLDFWKQEESVSPKSIFFDRHRGKMLRSPALSNEDGSPTKFAELLIELHVAMLFGDEESSSANRLNEYLRLEKKMELALHILATNPDSTTSSQSIYDVMTNLPSMLTENETSLFAREVFFPIGFNTTFFGSGYVLRSEYKEELAKCLEMHPSECNRGFFIMFCFASRSENSSFSEMIRLYYDMEERFLEPYASKFHGRLSE